MRRHLLALAIGPAGALACLLSPGLALADTATLVQSPSASVTAISFIAHGDLWSAAPQGGRATRLVRSVGSIMAARLSPDGRWIAYTDRTHGTQDLYIVPVGGGQPRRLTSDALKSRSDNLVLAWTPDSRKIVFLSSRGAWAGSVLRAFAVSIQGGVAEALPLDQVGTLCFSPNGGSVVYTRTHVDPNGRKRYLGGQAEDVFTFDLRTKSLRQITSWKGTDTAPVWIGDHIYFVSDQGSGFRKNLWRYDLRSASSIQVTHFIDYDVGTPAAGGGRILFEQGGRLWALELDGERLHQLSLDVPDDGARTAPRTMDAVKEIRLKDATGGLDFALAPNGGFAIFAAHGDLFRAPLPAGEARNLTSTPGVNEDHPTISPDGRDVAYVTEVGDAQQIAIRSLDGGAEHVLTHFPTGVFYSPTFSKDGRALAAADAEHNLWLVRRGGGDPVHVAFSPYADIRDAVFSPDGRWLAFSTCRRNDLQAIHLYDIAGGTDTVVSRDLESDSLPAFSPDSATLFFVSKRNELPFTTDRGDKTTISSLDSDGVFGASLSAGPIADLMRRAVRLPVTPARITSLEAREGAVIYATRSPALIGGELPGEEAALHRLDLATGQAHAFAKGFDHQVLSADGARALVERDGQWRVAYANASGGEQPVNLSPLRLTVDPRAEWREMLEQTWRLDRDLYFDRSLNGNDWLAVHDAYAKLLPLLGSREDFLNVLGQMQGELASSHARLANLDAAEDGEPHPTPRLGVDLALDARSGRYRIARIYRGDPTRPRFRSPLNAPALDGSSTPAREGDYLLAIDGVELTGAADPDSLLLGRTGAINLTVAGELDGSRRLVRVEPVESELNLRQQEWAEANRRRVEAQSGGHIGYIFVADFMETGSEDLLRQLQGQLDKDGLIFDIRWNRGGFTSQAVLDVLRRLHVGVFSNRYGVARSLPFFVAPRTMVVIENEEAGSDGDQFPYFFRAYGLGKVIGERTWGGVQGLDSPWLLLDGTGLFIPFDGLASPDGHWLIENEGTPPDLRVARAPDEIETGRDSQLDAALTEVGAELRLKPPPRLRIPAPLPAYPKAGIVPGAQFGQK